MKISLHNTLLRRKQEFVPIDKNNVRMYVCGPTVYDRAHLGNAKTSVVFDVLYRFLCQVYGKDHVTYVSNITDVDDKILNKHKETGKSIREITEQTFQWYLDDMKKLNVLNPNHRPRATEYIQEMIELVKLLLQNGHAYEAEGHVLFSVDSMPDYGFLSGRSMKEMLAGARIEVADYKKNPADFILWKPSEADQPGWDSPWGYGRPGWHLECSAMSSKLLGDSVKMSKSLGNFYNVDEIISKYPAEALRLLFLTTHYHQPFNFTFEGLNQAKAALDKFYNALRQNAAVKIEKASPNARLMEALADDVNTPLALSVLHEIVNNLNKSETEADKVRYKSELIASAEVLGLLYQDPEVWFKGASGEKGGLSESDIESKIAERLAAKKNKDYALADKIRGELKDAGIVLEDTPSGTTWKRA